MDRAEEKNVVNTTRIEEPGRVVEGPFSRMDVLHPRTWGFRASAIPGR